MTALVEREEIARAIFEATPDRFMRVEQCYPAADAILALRQPGAEYRRGQADAYDRAARLCENRSCGDPALNEAATAIRALSDSIPETKGGRDGR